MFTIHILPSLSDTAARKSKFDQKGSLGGADVGKQASADMAESTRLK